jgi:hypothetical protein
MATTAGYSGTPLPKKLGIAEGKRVALVDAPSGFERTLGALPDGVTLVRGLVRGAAFDVIVRFVSSRAELTRAFPTAVGRLQTDGALWIAWPKKASGVATDMTEDAVRDVALPAGLVDNKVCAIDATWSGLRCVWRRENRPTATKIKTKAKSKAKSLR